MKIMTLLLFVLFALSSCSTETTNNDVIDVSVETPFEIQVGQTASIEGHYFTFSEVTSDSRCPIDVKCIWAGEATIVLISQDDYLIYSDVYLSTNSTGAYTYLFPQTYIEKICNEDVCTAVQPPYELGYIIALNSLSPSPKSGEEIDPSEYVATLTIYLSE